jgi:chromate transporter
VLAVFGRLGVTSFGGPVAHLGYFRAELVTRRRWIDEQEYGDLVALSQFLPGPASSQVAYALGLHRAGVAGALAAFVAFTAPSAAVMVLAAAAGGTAAVDDPIGQGVVHGLEIVAVAVVAQAVLGMSKTLAVGRARAGIAAASLALALTVPGSWGQLVAIAAGGLLGLALCRDTPGPVANDGEGYRVSRGAGVACLVVFAALLVLLPLAAEVTGFGALRLFDACYRAGALVFGGGHVVLPLLEAGFVAPGWVTADQFVAGYGVAQAVPGPLFSFAAYLGALAEVGPGGAVGAAVGLAGIFLPGFLLLTGVLPFWSALRRRRWAGAVAAGIGAAVVGLLAAALYDPVFVTAVDSGSALALAAVCLVFLEAWRLAPWVVVLVGAGGGLLLQLGH